jgi:hypothetical protein
VGTFGGYQMSPERDDLTVVEQRIRAAKEYIYQQERLIERLADDAKNTDDAFALLNILNRAFDVLADGAVVGPISKSNAAPVGNRSRVVLIGYRLR